MPKASLRARLKKSLRPYWHHIRDNVRLARYAYYDYWRFRKHSGAFPLRTSAQAQAARITKFYHMVEKGLALPSPRPGFGHYAIGELCVLLDSEIAQGVRAPHVGKALECLQAYADFNAANGGETPAAVFHTLKQGAAAGIGCTSDAVKAVTREEIREATAFDVERFLATRFSVRQFAGGTIDRTTIEAAARMAQSAPSVCNRQSARVHVITDPARRAALLRFQNGNRGFGETASALAIITCDLTHFVEPSERYQAWVDGGLFAMTFALALHGLGLGSCFLNWSSPSDNDQRFRKAMPLGETETVITFLAIGTLPEQFTVARSPRKPLDDVLVLEANS
jgi:nitroreductase